VQIMKDYVNIGPREFDTYQEDPEIPNLPFIHYAGTTDYAQNDLLFRVEPFTDPQGDDTFAAMKWRIAEVEPFSSYAPSDETLETVTPAEMLGRPGKYEIQSVWESDEIIQFNPQVRIPASAVKSGQTYRVRCRMKDTSGRWSHWSAPEQFTVTSSIASSLQEQLRVTEIMYNPALPVFEPLYDNDAFEFIELTNIGTSDLILSGLSFSDGITFDFAQGSIQNLFPSQSILVVKSLEAFVTRYGQQAISAVAGEYQGQLSNGGETVELTDIWEGEVLEFTYDDQWYPSTDGSGDSLELTELGQSNPEILSLASAWQPSIQTGGSPGEHILP
ncbi:lamin tail domain-containing protein, partial [Planctomycetota bacterium]